MVLRSKTKCFLLLALVTILSISFPACVIDDTTPNAIPPHNYTSFESLFNDTLYQVDSRTIDASEAVEITTAGNSNIAFPENSLFEANGSVATGATELQFIELLTKSDLLMSGLSMERNNGNILEMAAGFSITAWQNNESLDFDGTIELDFDDPGLSSSPSELSVFYSGTDNSPLEEASDQSSVTLAGDRFELSGSQIGWILAAKDFIPSNGTTDLSLTSNLNENEITEERAFVLFNDFKGVLRLPKNGNSYSTIGLPIDQSATIVMIAFDQQKFYIDVKETTITESQNLEMNLLGYPVADFVTLLRGID